MRKGPKSRFGRQPSGVFSALPNGMACHKDLRKIAVEMAHEAYSALMSRNEWYDALKAANPGVSTRMLERGWVNMHWPQFVEGARAALAATLREPLPEPLKEHAMEVLILDASLTRGRRAGRIEAARKADQMRVEALKTNA